MPVSRATRASDSAVRPRTLRRSARVPYPDTWDLSHLLADRKRDFEPAMKGLEAKVARFESARETLTGDLSPAAMLALLQQQEDIALDAARLGAHAYLWYSENTADGAARSYKTLVEDRLTALHNRLLFFDLWWQEVDDNRARRLMEGAARYRYHLETIRRFTPHTLSEPEEKILNIKNTTGRSAITTLYDIVTNGLTFSLSVNGRRRTLSREELSTHFRSTQAGQREAAYREFYRVFHQHHDVLGEMYRALVTDWKAEQLGLRHFSAPIQSRNLSNDIPDEAVSTLLKVCVKNASVFQHYFRIKGKLCRSPKMSRYHIYAPFRGSKEASYSYQNAIRLVLESYRGFSPTMADLAEQVFTDHHIDARIHAGKLGGAYCYSVAPGMTPYVLLNYTGKARDVATMAHELGHAVHGMLAAHHSVFTFHSTLPLAETASVFGERILSDALLQQEHNAGVRQGLLVDQLDDVYATVMRQAYFVQFERSAHDMVANGATVRDLAGEYARLLQQQFGKAVSVPKEFQWEWVTIPHMYASPFYCYAYSFGNLLVLALYGMYKQQGSAFIPRYLELLAMGGSESPASILGKVGVDMCSPDFWQAGFEMIKEMVQALERTV